MLLSVSTRVSSLTPASHNSDLEIGELAHEWAGVPSLSINLTFSMGGCGRRSSKAARTAPVAQDWLASFFLSRFEVSALLRVVS